MTSSLPMSRLSLFVILLSLHGLVVSAQNVNSRATEASSSNGSSTITPLDTSSSNSNDTETTNEDTDLTYSTTITSTLAAINATTTTTISPTSTGQASGNLTSEVDDNLPSDNQTVPTNTSSLIPSSSDLESEAEALEVVVANELNSQARTDHNTTLLEDDFLVSTEVNWTNFPHNNGTEEEEEHLVEGILSVGDGFDLSADNSNQSSPNESSSTTNNVTAFAEGRAVQDNPAIDFQTQIYIVSGTLGGILLLLIILVLALALSVAKLRDQIEKRHQRYLAEDNINHHPLPGSGGEQLNTYDNPAFSGTGAGPEGTEMQERSVDAKMEIARRGYTVYNGNSQENSYGPNARDSRSTLMRYEDGVIPMADKPEAHRQSGRPYRY